jgi:1-phosphofructokinase family hexose kinase
VALGFVAGATGKRLAKLLDGYEMEHDLVWVDGDTRTAHVIVETSYHRHSHIVTKGYTVNPADLEEFFQRYRKRVVEASWVIGAGSLADGVPVEFYREITAIAHQAGVKVAIDCPREPALQAAFAFPEIFKMNRSEYASTFGGVPESIIGLVEDAKRLLEGRNLPAVVITCGDDGILAVTQEGSYLATSPRQQEVNAAGAGDAVSAALAWRFSKGESWPQALRWAAAASAAVVLTEGTADCKKDDIERIYAEAQVQRI